MARLGEFTGGSYGGSGSDIRSVLRRRRAEKEIEEPTAADVATESRRTDVRAGAGADLARSTQDDARKAGLQLVAQLEASGQDTGQAYERALHLAETGQQKETGFWNRVGGYIDASEVLLKGAVMDVLQLDQKAGHEIDYGDLLENAGNPEVLKQRYPKWYDEGANWTNPAFNTSAIMEELGWDKSETWYGKLGRGAVQFAADTVTSPLSYTGLGRVGQGASVLVGRAASVLDDAGRAVLKSLPKAADDVTDALDVAIRRSALEKATAAGIKELDNPALMEPFVKEAVDNYKPFIVKNFAKRDYGAMPQAWKKSRRVGQAGPGMKGGIQLQLNPLATQRFNKAVSLPGTQGLGRKLSRTVFGTRQGTEDVRGFLMRKATGSGTGIAGKLDEFGFLTAGENLMGGLSQKYLVNQIRKRGVQEGLQIADLLEGGLARAQTDLGLRDLGQEFVNETRRFVKEAKNLSNEDYAQVGQVIVEGIQQNLLPRPVLTQFDEVEPTMFLEQLEAAAKTQMKGDREYGEILSRPKNLEGAKTYLSPSGKTGVAIQADGEIIQFSIEGGANDALRFGQRHGGDFTKLFDEDGRAAEMAAKKGWNVDERIPFDEAKAPSNWKGEAPDRVRLSNVEGEPNTALFREALPDSMTEEQVQATIDMATRFQMTLEQMYRTARSVDMDLGEMDNYVPLVWAKDFNQLIERMAARGIGVDVDAAPEDIREGAMWLSEVLGGRGRRSASPKTMLGESRFANERGLGREVAVRDFGALTLVEGLGGANIKYATHAELNDQIGRAAEWLAKQNNMSAKFDTALQMDPANIMNSYINSMGAALQERWLLRELANVGAITDATFERDAGRIMSSILGEAQSERVQRLLRDKQRAVRATIDGQADELAQMYDNTFTMELGPGLPSLEIPAQAWRSKDPALVKMVDRAKRKARTLKATKDTLDRQRERMARELMANGVDETLAREIAGAESVREMKNVARAAAEAAREEATVDVEALMEVARRYKGDAAQSGKAYERAVREANRVHARAARQADKAYAAVHKEAQKLLNERAKQVLPAITLDSPEAREAFVGQLTRHIDDKLDMLAEGAEDDTVRQVVEQLKDIVAEARRADADFDTLAQELANVLGVGRGARAVADVPQARVDAIRGEILEAVQKGTRNFETLSPHARGVREAATRPGGVQPLKDAFTDFASAFAAEFTRISKAYRANPSPGLKKTMQQMADYADEVDQLAYRLEDGVSARLPGFRIDEFLNGNELVGEFQALRKIAAGQNVMSDTRAAKALRRMLTEQGYLGDEVRLRANPNAQNGFELVPSRPWAPVAEAAEAVRRRGYTLSGALGALDELEGSLSPEVLATLRNLNELPHFERQIAKLDESIRDAHAFLRATLDPSDSRSAADIMAEQADVLGRLRDDVLRPFRNKSSSRADLEKARNALRGLKPQLEKILAPADRAALDVLYDEVATEAALAGVAQGNRKIFRDVVEARNAYRATIFDADTTAESIAKTGRQIAQRLSEDLVDEQRASYEMVAVMNDTIQRMLGMVTDDTGATRRRFLTPEENEEFERLLGRGRRAWEKLGFDGDSPFVDVKVPTAERPEFVPPSKYNLGGVLDEQALVVDRYAAEWLENTLGLLTFAANPDGLAAIGGAMRKVINIWKTQATVVRPTFHIRNFIGAFWNGMYADVGLQDYRLSFQHTAKFERALHGSANLEEAFLALPEGRVRAAYRAAWDQGVFSDTFADTEILSKVGRRTMTQKLNPLSQDSYLVRAGGKSMQGIEAHMRMAVFLRHFNDEALDTLASARVAKQWVDMVHFNYSDLTQWESNIKRYVPFFVWFRRNLPLQMQTLVERPGMLARYQNLIQAIDAQDEGFMDDDLPHSMWREGTMFAGVGQLNEDTPFWARVLIDPDLPIENIMELEPTSGASWLSLLANQLGPQFDLARLAAEDEEDYWVTAPGGISQLINALPEWAAQKVGARGDNPYNVPRMSPRASQIWRLLLPSLNELGGFALEQAPNRRQRMGQLPLEGESPDDSLAADLEAAGWMLARGLGVQLEGADEAYSNSVVSKMETDSMRRELTKEGIILPDAADMVSQATSRLVRESDLWDSIEQAINEGDLDDIRRQIMVGVGEGRAAAAEEEGAEGRLTAEQKAALETLGLSR